MRQRAASQVRDNASRLSTQHSAVICIKACFKENELMTPYKIEWNYKTAPQGWQQIAHNVSIDNFNMPEFKFMMKLVYS